jgi:hypothetical protein
MAEEVHRAITVDIKVAKYFSIIVDLTPDVSCVYQLVLIFHYMSPGGTPVECFLLFLIMWATRQKI